ncbi:hypothetical protein Tco_1268431, partial [Tanacetum coccineum]
PGFGYWQWRLATLPFAFRRLRVYSAGDVLYYAFLASQLQSVGLQTKLIRHAGIGPTFDDALCVFNTSMKTGLLSNPSEIAAPKLMKKIADIYFTQVTKNAESTFSLSHRQMDLWRSQREDHTSDLLRAVPISGLGPTMNRKLISGWIGFDRPLRPADMLLHSWDGGLDVFVDLTGSSSLTQTGMTYCMPGQVVIDAAQRKRVKYMAKCAAIGYKFHPFSFSSLGELEEDAVTLLKRSEISPWLRTFGAHAVVHIFNRISFAIAKGVKAQIVSRLSSNLL